MGVRDVGIPGEIHDDVVRRGGLVVVADVLVRTVGVLAVHVAVLVVVEAVFAGVDLVLRDVRDVVVIVRSVIIIGSIVIVRSVVVIPFLFLALALDLGEEAVRQLIHHRTVRKLEIELPVGAVSGGDPDVFVLVVRLALVEAVVAIGVQPPVLPEHDRRVLADLVLFLDGVVIVPLVLLADIVDLGEEARGRLVQDLAVLEFEVDRTVRAGRGGDVDVAVLTLVQIQTPVVVDVEVPVGPVQNRGAFADLRLGLGRIVVIALVDAVGRLRALRILAVDQAVLVEAVLTV